MNKLILLCGLVMLGTTTTPQENKLTSNCTTSEDSIYVSIEGVNSHELLAMETETIWKAPKLVSRISVNAPEDIKVSEIVFIEEEPSIELGFDTAEYLPEGFDPYSVYFDVNAIEFIDEEMAEQAALRNGGFFCPGWPRLGLEIAPHPMLDQPKNAVLPRAPAGGLSVGVGRSVLGLLPRALRLGVLGGRDALEG